MLNVNELFVKNPVVININSVNGINTVNPLTLPSSTRLDRGVLRYSVIQLWACVKNVIKP